MSALGKTLRDGRVGYGPQRQGYGFQSGTHIMHFIHSEYDTYTTQVNNVKKSLVFVKA